MIGAAIVLALTALTALGFAVVAADARARARADRKVAERVYAATAQHVREQVLRKPFSVVDRPPLAMIVDGAPLPIPRGSHPVFGRVPRGVS